MDRRTRPTGLPGFRVWVEHSGSGEIADASSEHHQVLVVTKGNVAVERAWRGERWRKWTAYPGSVSVLPANFPVAMRWRGAAETIVVELEAGLFEAAITGEEGLPSIPTLRPRIPSDDAPAQRIALNLWDDLVANQARHRLHQ